VKVVVALGRIAFDAWLQLLRSRDVSIRPRPQFAHGAAVIFNKLPTTGYRLPTLIGCYHPSRQNTNTGKLTPQMMVDVFRKARKLL
jgi:uracil-DNA glycosylase